MDYNLEAAANGLTMEAFVSTIVYSLTGIVILLITVMFVNAVFKLSLHRELVKEHNTAFGIVIGGMAIAIAIIIAGTISS